MLNVPKKAYNSVYQVYVRYIGLNNGLIIVIVFG